ncbi:programmed cell death protein 1, partial [Microtus ochrogaster]
GGLKPTELPPLSFHLAVNCQVLSQSTQYVSIPEGKDVSMSCNSSSALDNVLWYKQDPKEGLVLLVAL